MALTFVGTANPFEPPSGYTALATGTAQTLSGAWFLASGTQASWRDDRPLTDTVISATVIVSTINSDSRGCALANDEGDGYFLLARNTDLRLYLYNNGVLGSLLATVTMTVAEGASVKIDRTLASGAMRFYVNDVDVGGFTDNTYTTGFYGYLFSRGGRITSFDVSGVSAAPSIVLINADDTVVQGSTGNTIETSLLTVSTLSIGGIAVALTEVDPDNHTWDMPGFVDTEVYPVFGVVSAAVNTDEATKDVTLSLDPDYTATPMDTLSEADDCIATVAASEGLTIVATDTLYNSAGLTIYDDSTISDADDGTHIVWHRAAATNVMTQINLIVSGGVIVTGNLTARALTDRSLTSRSLTVRSL